MRREGRLTAAQQRALTELWPVYGLPDQPPRLDFGVLFGRTAPVCLEIGFGSGDALCALAAASPERDFLGVEVYRPGVGRLLLQAEALDLRNLRISMADAVELLGERIPEASLDEVLIFFPDPWPKKRHHKRRLVQPAFVALVVSRLQPSGRLRLATDWEDYAGQMLRVLEAEPGLRNLAGGGCFAPRPESRPQTRFELRGRRLGHGVWDLAFERIPGIVPRCT